MQRTWNKSKMRVVGRNQVNSKADLAMSSDTHTHTHPFTLEEKKLPEASVSLEHIT